MDTNWCKLIAKLRSTSGTSTPGTEHSVDPVHVLMIVSWKKIDSEICSRLQLHVQWVMGQLLHSQCRELYWLFEKSSTRWTGEEWLKKKVVNVRYRQGMKLWNFIFQLSPFTEVVEASIGEKCLYIKISLSVVKCTFCSHHPTLTIMRSCCVLHLAADTSAGRLNSSCWTCCL